MFCLSLKEPLLTSNDIDSKKIPSCKTNKRQLFRIISYFFRVIFLGIQICTLYIKFNLAILFMMVVMAFMIPELWNLKPKWVSSRSLGHKILLYVWAVLLVCSFVDYHWPWSWRRTKKESTSHRNWCGKTYIARNKDHH